MSSLGVTIGALLIGNLCAAAVWGISSFQTFTYFSWPQQDSTDGVNMRLLVSILWILDTLHIAFASHAVYYYTILNFNNSPQLNHIVWSLALTIGITAIITFIVHCFFARRIYQLSRGNRWIPALICVLATARLGFGFGSVVECFILETFTNFSRVVRWLFTTGLSLAVLSDTIITLSCCYYLALNRSGFRTMDLWISTIQRYLIQSGAMTTLLTAVSAICAASMPRNLVWIGAHFVISKLYTASLVAALNSRDALREARLDPKEPIAFQLSRLQVKVDHTRETGVDRMGLQKDSSSSLDEKRGDPESKCPCSPEQPRSSDSLSDIAQFNNIYPS